MNLFFLISIILFLVKSDNQDQQPEVDWILSYIEGEVIDIKWCKDSQNVLALTDQNHVYYSSNNGRTWVSLKNQLKKKGEQSLEFDDEQVGEVKSMIESPVDNSIIFFQGTQDVDWISQDCGQTVQAINTGRPIDEIQWHPLKRDWLLVAAWSKCEDFEDDQQCEITKEVFMSQDLGNNWKLLKNFIYQFAWAKQTKESQVPEQRIIIAHEQFGKGHQKNFGWSENIHIYQSDDFFNTKQILIPQGNSFLITDNYFFAVKLIDKISDDVELLISNPNQKQYKFQSIQAPIKRLRQHGYTILDTSEGQVFININHGEGNHQYGNLYISDVNGIKYSASLANNVRNNEGYCDFEKLESMEGVYLSNIYDHSKIELINQGKDLQRTQQQVNKANYVMENLNKFKQTRISFDKGGIWKPLSPPAFDINNKTFPCPQNDQCYLNLNSHSSNNFGPYYSSKNAIALLIGTGNVGTHLSVKPDEQSTFLSRDAGKSWQQIAEGSHVYEIGDHGGILLLAEDQTATDKLKYSWDEGLTFQTLKINEKIQISNILTEPSNTGLHFIVIGNKLNGKSVFLCIDFTSLHKRNCKGMEDPSDYESDFEYFTIQENSDDLCILGRATTYIKKKQSSQCFNQELQEKIYKVRNCTCTIYDWECDVGFSRQEDGQCVSKKEIVFEEPKICEDTYLISQGYRKVSGSTCVYGIDKSPYEFKCGSWQLSRKLPYFLFLSLLIFLVFQINQYTSLFKNIQETINLKFKDPKKEGYKAQSDDIDIDSTVFDNNDEQAENIYQSDESL